MYDSHLVESAATDEWLSKEVTQASPVVMGDLVFYPPTNRIVGASVKERRVMITWDDGQESTFHMVWLRDCCACPICRHPQTLERTFNQLNIPANIRAMEVTVTEQGSLKLIWDHESHVSQFDAGWLRAHCYSDSTRASRRHNKHLWGAELLEKLPSFDYDTIMSSDRQMMDWLLILRDVGIARVRGVPSEDGQVARVANRIGRVRETNFGTVFDVFNQAEPINNAYTAIELPPHTDLPNWELPPGIQFLHFLHNEVQGGQSVYVDGFKLAEVLRTEDPAAFHLLTKIPLNFRFHDETCDYRYRAPVIRLDSDGALSEIRFNPSVMAPLNAPADQMEDFYLAYRKYAQLTRDSRFQLRLRMAAGDLISFANGRILHGRTAFVPTTGCRHLQGCYVDRDELTNRICMIERMAGRYTYLFTK